MLLLRILSWVASLQKLTSPRLWMSPRRLPRLQSPRAQVEFVAPLAPTPISASSTKGTLNLNPMGARPSLEPAESPKTTTSSGQSHGLSSAGSVPLDGDSAWPQSEDPNQRPLQVVETLARYPYYIKVGFHIGMFIIAAVDTKADHANIEVLWTDLDSASTRINVSVFCLILHYRLRSILTSPFFCLETD
jgi:hypothetical protein